MAAKLLDGKESLYRVQGEKKESGVGGSVVEGGRQGRERKKAEGRSEGEMETR